jgi:hypothetical protein
VEGSRNPYPSWRCCTGGEGVVDSEGGLSGSESEPGEYDGDGPDVGTVATAGSGWGRLLGSVKRRKRHLRHTVCTSDGLVVSQTLRKGPHRWEVRFFWTVILPCNVPRRCSMRKE